MPDQANVTTTHVYYAAHRLVKFTDAQDNYGQYTPDAARNKTVEQTNDASDKLHKSLSRSFNSLYQPTKVTDRLSHAVFDAGTSSSYGTNGNFGAKRRWLGYLAPSGQCRPEPLGAESQQLQRHELIAASPQTEDQH